MFADGHCDTITAIFESKQKLFKNNGHIDIERIIPYGNIVQVFAIWLNPKHYVNAADYTQKVIDFYYSELEENKKYIAPVHTYSDISENKKRNRSSAILGLEGAEAIGKDLNNIEKMYKQGVRLIGLTWNHSNALATGIIENEKNRGLTDLGFNTVEIMNELGIIIDVSHLSEKSFWDVCEVSKQPFIASHSNAYSIMGTDRNLRDAQIRAVAEKGGVVGLNLYSAFLTDEPKSSLEHLLKHAAHIINIGGEDVISLGSDFDGIDSMPFEFSDIKGIQIIMDRVSKEFGARVAEKMAEKNFLNAIERILK